MQKKHLIQGTPEWLAMRKNFVMASDAPIIMNGLHFEKTPKMLWEEKLGLDKPKISTFIMDLGKSRERCILEAYERRSGIRMEPAVVFHKQISFMGASLDGLNRNGDKAVELKLANKVDHDCALKGKVPKKYYPQVQQQIACQNLPGMDYFSFNEILGEALVRVERDEPYIQDLYRKVSLFWNYVLNLEAPPLCKKDEQLHDCEEWGEVANRWLDRQPILKELLEENERDKEILASLSGETNGRGGGVRASRIERKGSIEYAKIPELKNVDLEIYRKKSSEYWKISPAKGDSIG